MSSTRAVTCFLAALAIVASACSAPSSLPARCPAAPAPVISAVTAPAPAAEPARDQVGPESMIIAAPGVDVEPVTTREQRAQYVRWAAEARAAAATVFGASSADAPLVVSCVTDDCKLKLMGPTRRSIMIARPRAMAIVGGFSPTTPHDLTHELVHGAVAARLGEAHHVPAWFNEGLATFIGDNVPCPAGTPRGIEDLRRLDHPGVWTNYTNVAGRMLPTYCQARAEIAAWVAAHSREAIVGVLDAVVAGRTFDDAYGPLVTAAAPADWDHSLVGSFAFDDHDGASAVDASPGAHMASLQLGALWTAGKHDGGVGVREGAFVRADGFVELAEPDAPFSLSVWVHPLATGEVIIHLATELSGTREWCTDLLGADADGRVLAQVALWGGAGWLRVTGPKLAVKKWTHLAVTWSGDGGLQLYVDGTRAAGMAPRSERERHRSATGEPVYIFAGTNPGCKFSPLGKPQLTGALDALHVYDYELTPALVAADFKMR